MQSLAKIVFFTGIFVVLSFVPIKVFAADFYIAQSAAGAKDGSSCSNARDPDWFNNPANLANPKQPGKIGPGDTVHLCGTISSKLGVFVSGSEGTPITIRFEEGAKLSSPSWNGIALKMNNQSYIVVDGNPPGVNTSCGWVNGALVPCNGIIENTDNGTGSYAGGTYDHQQNAQGIWATGCNHCEIKNLTIQNIYKRTSLADTLNGADYSLLEGIVISGSNNSVHNNIIRDTGVGIGNPFSDGETANSFYNNDIGNVNWAMYASIGSGQGGNFYFYDNHVHDYEFWDEPAHNYFHHNGIHFYGYGRGYQQVWIYNNTFDGNPGLYVTGHIYSEEWSGPTAWYVFNNVFAASANNAWVQLWIKGSDSVVANNTFINGGLQMSDQTNPIVKNNFFYAQTGNGFLQLNVADGSPGTIVWSPVSVEAQNIDYNYYSHCSGTACWNAGTTTTSTSVFSTWQGHCNSCDKNSYADLSGDGGENLTTYQPALDSPLLSKGQNLSSLGITELQSDINGSPRPATGAWDIGAYQRNTGVLLAPSNLRVTE